MSNAHQRRPQQGQQQQRPSAEPAQAEAGEDWGFPWNSWGLDAMEDADVGAAGGSLLEAAGEQMGEAEAAAESSWFDWLPSGSWDAADHEEDHTRLLGGDDQSEDDYLDLLSSESGYSASASMDASGAQAEFEAAKRFALLEGAVDADLTTDAMRDVGMDLGGSAKGSVMEAGAGAKGAAAFDLENMSGKAEGEAELGAYLAQVEGEGELGWKIPFINARLFGKGSASANVGVGAQASGIAAMDENGFELGGSIGASLGLGGSLGFSWGMQKADPNAGWLW